MIVDDALAEAALQQLLDCFGERAGAASAVYTLEGSMFTSVSLDCINPGSSVEPETGAIVEALKRKERISAVLTVIRRTAGGPVLFSTPAGPTIDRLCLAGARETEVAVHNLAKEDSYFIRPLKNLGATHISELGMDGRYDDGMRPIVRELRLLARVQAEPTVEQTWEACFHSALRNRLVRRYAQHQGKKRHPFEFRHANEAKSFELRLVWNAFEATSHAVFRAIFDHHDAGLRDIGMNESDLLHLRQGGEAFRFVFGNLIVWVDLHKPIESELPFVPYHTSRLTKGRPMHEAFDAAAVGGDPIDELVDILTRTDEHGVAEYLHQRGLFTHPVFDNGTRRCPFDVAAVAAYRSTGAAITSARAADLLDADWSDTDDTAD